jgi:hypothetical protein
MGHQLPGREWAALAPKEFESNLKKGGFTMNMKLTKQVMTGLLCCLLLQFTAQAGSYFAAGQSENPSPAPAGQQSPQELQQLVAPIALYPDALVEADRWMQGHSSLKGEELAREVDKQPWDPSVKALTQFPSVLENMDKNLSWTSSLGDAYANQQQDVMDAVQAMRQQARKAGNLNSNEQEKVTTQGDSIVIDPVDTDVVYVPAYDPWLAYGYPIVAYPGWYPVPGIFYDGPGLFFGVGFGIGFFGGFGWGWNNWGWDWHGHRMLYDHHDYVSHSRTIVNRNNFNGHNNSTRGDAFGRSNSADRSSTFHGSLPSHGQAGMRSGAFSGFDHGGNVRGFSSRGQASFGGGFHGGGGFGGGGFHGGGGGGRR